MFGSEAGEEVDHFFLSPRDSHGDILANKERTASEIFRIFRGVPIQKSLCRKGYRHFSRFGRGKKNFGHQRLFITPSAGRCEKTNPIAGGFSTDHVGFSTGF